MQFSDIEEFFNNFPFLKKQFKGFFSIDTLNSAMLKYREFCICNTDKSTGLGIHWFCVIRSQK
jgi:hypothetical protein